MKDPNAVRAWGGFGVTVLFALYYGGLGLWRASPWYGSIGAYYLLLSLLRGMLLAAEGRAAGRADADAYRRRVLRVTIWLLLLLDAALIGPITLMVLDRRPVRVGMIPAIASAAYTTYRVAAAVVRMRRGAGTVLARALRVLQLTDALAAVLVLQNTLLLAVDGGISPQMRTLAAASSGGILLAIFSISIVFAVRGRASA